MGYILGLTTLEKAILQNYTYMTAALAGTRQIRRRIGWVHVSSRIVHGVPHFMTVTPSEKHSGLCVRLMRYREGDPGLQTAHGTLFKPWIGSNVPSLCAPEGVVEIDLPEYDLRRAMTFKDPLCCLLAFWINVRVILSNLYGWRMCPQCRHCAEGPDPCMDIYGSNATCMGGSCGRADAAVGAVEAQKAEGVLHLHVYVFLQMLHQYQTRAEIGAMLREQFVSVEAMKRFISYSRCAAYPEFEKFQKEQQTHRTQLAGLCPGSQSESPPHKGF